MVLALLLLGHGALAVGRPVPRPWAHSPPRANPRLHSWPCRTGTGPSLALWSNMLLLTLMLPECHGGHYHSHHLLETATVGGTLIGKDTEPHKAQQHKRPLHLHSTSDHVLPQQWEMTAEDFDCSNLLKNLQRLKYP